MTDFWIGFFVGILFTIFVIGVWSAMVVSDDDDGLF